MKQELEAYLKRYTTLCHNTIYSCACRYIYDKDPSSNGTRSIVYETMAFCVTTLYSFGAIEMVYVMF